MYRLHHPIHHRAAMALFSAATVFASSVAVRAAGTETAARVRQGKLVASDSAAVQRTQVTKFVAETNPDNAPAPAATPDVLPRNPTVAGIPTPVAAEPHLLHELQADDQAGAAETGHLKVISGLALLLLIGYVAFRRFMPQG